MRWTLKYGSFDQKTGNMVSDGVCLFSAEDFETATELAEQKLTRWRSYPYSGLQDVEWCVVKPIEKRRYKKETKDQYVDKKPKGWKLHKGPFEYFAKLEAERKG